MVMSWLFLWTFFRSGTQFCRAFAFRGRRVVLRSEGSRDSRDNPLFQWSMEQQVDQSQNSDHSEKHKISQNISLKISEKQMLRNASKFSGFNRLNNCISGVSMSHWTNPGTGWFGSVCTKYWPHIEVVAIQTDVACLFLFFRFGLWFFVFFVWFWNWCHVDTSWKRCSDSSCTFERV